MLEISIIEVTLWYVANEEREKGTIPPMWAFGLSQFKARLMLNL